MPPCSCFSSCSPTCCCRANEHPRFPEGGKMSQHLDSLAVGDSMEVKGPVGHFVYEGRGRFTLNRKPGSAK